MIYDNWCENSQNNYLYLNNFYLFTTKYIPKTIGLDILNEVCTKASSQPRCASTVYGLSGIYVHCLINFMNNINYIDIISICIYL